MSLASISSADFLQTLGECGVKQVETPAWRPPQALQYNRHFSLPLQYRKCPVSKPLLRSVPCFSPSPAGSDPASFHFKRGLLHSLSASSHTPCFQLSFLPMWSLFCLLPLIQQSFSSILLYPHPVSPFLFDFSVLPRTMLLWAATSMLSTASSMPTLIT